GLAYEIALLSREVDTAHREARLVRRGLHITIAPGSTGRVLDQSRARAVILDALASFSRAPVALPVKQVSPRVTVASLAATQRLASQIIAAPVTVVAGPTRLRIPRWRLATILDLPAGDGSSLSFTGPAASRYFARLEKSIDREPRDAACAINASGTVRIVPSVAGVQIDSPRTAARILAAAEQPTNRVARLVLS